jgi:hypothetical protein
MKLLTHNMLASTIKGVQNGFPLRIEAAEVVEREADFDAGAAAAGARPGAAAAAAARARAGGEGGGVGRGSRPRGRGGLRWQRAPPCVRARQRNAALTPSPPLLPLPPPSLPPLDFLRHIYPKLEWGAFVEAARAVSTGWGRGGWR